MCYEDAEQSALPLQNGRHPGPLFGPLSLRKPNKSTLRGRHYRRKRRLATPPWADLAAIRALYKQAKELTRRTGVLHSVDHVLPLKGENVCGLHVHTNMQILTHRENMSKGNKFVDQLSLL